jgi:hypothetical protein
MTTEEKILIVGACKQGVRDIITSLESTLGVNEALSATLQASVLFDEIRAIRQMPEVR